MAAGPHEIELKLRSPRGEVATLLRHPVVRALKRGRALEMILSAGRVDAATALAWGLVNREAPLASLKQVTEDLAKAMLANGPLAQAMALESVLRGTEVSLEEGLRIECDLFGIVSSTKDMREGLNAFLEKRKPTYRGE